MSYQLAAADAAGRGHQIAGAAEADKVGGASPTLRVRVPLLAGGVVAAFVKKRPSAANAKPG